MDDDDDRSVWQIVVGLGPGTTTHDSVDSEEIPPIARALEESAHRVRGVNRIPCYTEYGPSIEIAAFAQRAFGENIDPSTLPVECSLAVYATDAELDELTQAIVADLGVDRDGYSTAVGGHVSLGLRPISIQDPSNGFYRHLVDQYQDHVASD
ncbi:hypothetical protein [Nocardia alba]|uniref:Uncharacterized protein n=1 Tax=Nocardia alba TaxID=225051 RepID=A0A4R1FW57_9NOCA|nr:hypothetical protein [Nocardia alba]TCJ96878.1 hypothetical protein DFR71_2912 [Nocardia alba]